jgi:uncharacterized secreted repeat protein (TIGR03808 family)
MRLNRRILLAAPFLLRAQSAAAQNTSALQTALNKGGKVALGAGTLEISEPLVIPRNASISGVPGQTILRGRGVTALMKAEGLTNLYISGLTFDGGEAGLQLQGCAGGVTGNSFRNQSDVALFSQNATGLEIASNTINDIGNNGIQVWRSEKGEDGTLVHHNRIARIAARNGGSGQNGNGINVFRSGNVNVSNNRISDCAYSGIRNNAGANCQIIANNISRTAEVGIYVEFGFDGAVVASNLLEDVGFGISVTNYNEGGRLAVVNGNIIRKARGSNTEGVKAGGGIFAEADTMISNNVIEGARDIGIALGWGANCRNLSAVYNIIRNAPVGITVSVTEGARNVRLAGNQFDQVEKLMQGRDYDVVKTGDLSKEKPPAHIVID